MIINEDKYVLSIDNYIAIENKKKQIVIGHTFNHNMRHYIGWLHRYNGKYKKTAAFSIDTEGIIYKHFDPKYQSKFFNNDDLNNKTIVILIENDGWLLKNNQKKEFITWLGDIYNKPDDVVLKKWRGYDYWCPYNEKQLESATYLIKRLCDSFLIPMTSISHNTKIENIIDNNYTVIYRSNLDKHYTDLNPSWDFERFKNKLELN